ncbi:MAG: hypothetical protein KGI11_09230 [Thaumarchaeota archaeon]|nr:hypothetical protein [Nitrososphaerota archaeon]
MTQFAVEPYKQVTIRSYMKYESAEAFAKAATHALSKGMGGRLGNFFWANGVIFKHSPYAQTDSVTKQYLEGMLTLDHIEYALMSEFRNEIRVEDFVLTVLDVSKHTLFRELTKWIKGTLEKK